MLSSTPQHAKGVRARGGSRYGSVSPASMGIFIGMNWASKYLEKYMESLWRSLSDCHLGVAPREAPGHQPPPPLVSARGTCARVWRVTIVTWSWKVLLVGGVTTVIHTASARYLQVGCARLVMTTGLQRSAQCTLEGAPVTVHVPGSVRLSQVECASAGVPGSFDPAVLAKVSAIKAGLSPSTDYCLRSTH